MATTKNVIHPDLIRNHFEAFIKLTDKGRAKKILGPFLKTCSYVGYTDGLDIEKLAQTTRRIYKTPGDCKEISILLDFMIIIALSSAPFEDFDPKSKIFIEQTLDHVDQHFKGFNTIDQQIESSKSHATQTVTLNYFDTIESENKTFNKKLVGKKVPEMVQEKIYDLMPIDSITYFDKNAVNKVKKSKKK